ncbi:MAG: cupin domain-containing protein [Pseudomonadota bacterium]
MRLNQRILNSSQFKRRQATADTKRKIGDWDIWECEGPEYQYDYDCTVSLYVHEGSAVLTFDNGETVDLIADDFLTIEKGSSATWAISTPIRNSYRYHNTFHSASNRANQVRWQKN